MRSLLLGLPLTVACGFTTALPAQPVDAAGDVVDASDPACVPAFSYTPSNFEPCMADVVGPQITIDANYTFDSATGVLDGNGSSSVLPTTGTMIRVVSIAGLTIEDGARLRILGNQPLILAVHGDAMIAGTLTASAIGAMAGAGAAACAGNKGTNADGNLAKSAGGGGGGGAFGSLGANGGTGDTSQNPTLGGAVMMPVGLATLVPLRGGCAGGAGGEEHPTAMATAGGGGGGGGAVQLTVRDQLIVAGTARIESNGGAGVGATNQANGANTHAGAGGGGGGSGGGVFLEAKTVSIQAAARLCANGGGGGGGSHDGTDGSDGLPVTCAEAAATGGAGNGAAGDGGFASMNATAGSPGGGMDGGGGGGGGGVGRIRVRAVMGPAPSGFVSTPPALVQ